jgi:hypothetical protein
MINQQTLKQGNNRRLSRWNNEFARVFSFVFVLVVLGLELQALYKLGKYSSTESHF